MVLDLVPVYKEEGYKATFEHDGDLSSLEVGFGEYPFIEPVKVSGTVKNVSGEIELRGSVLANCSTRCDRCQKDIVFQLEAPFIYYISAEPNEDIDEILTADNKKIDLYRVAELALIVEYPAKHICKEDCRGLCLICGADLNEGNCGCEKKEIDPRLAALKKLID